MLLLIRLLMILTEIIAALCLVALMVLAYGAVFIQETYAEHKKTLAAILMWVKRAVVWGSIALACYLAGR